jgi:hypothetical protein
MDRTKELRAGSNIDIVTNDGRGFFSDTTYTDDNTVANAAVVAKSRITADYNPAEVIYDKVAADIDLTRHLDASDYLREFQKDVIEQREKFARDRRPNPIAPASKAI